MITSIDFKKEWKAASVTLKKLLKQENVPRVEWHELFATNNRITSWVKEGSNELLKALERELTKHVGISATKIHSCVGDDDLLRAYIGEWSKYSVLIEYLPHPFSFIARGPQKGTGGISRTEKKTVDNTFIVQNCMYRIWNQQVLETIHSRLLSSAMELVLKERLGETIDSQLVVGVRQSFVIYSHGKINPLEAYEQYFEKQYIDSCREFYVPRALQILTDNGIFNYMAYAYEKLTEEDERSKRYLDMSKPESYNRFIEASVKILVIQFQEQLLAEAAKLIAENETDRLRMLYGLLNKTADGIQPLLDYLCAHIKSEGLQTMRENAETLVTDPEKYVDQLIALYTKFSTLIKDAFCNDVRFLTIRDQSFQDVVNNTEIFHLEFSNQKGKGKTNNQPPESKCPELLANYCDLLLRKSALTKKLTTEEIEERLNKVLLILKYVSNKDVFMRYHKNHLSRRLIFELTADQSMEEGLVNKFRETGMPSDFVSKLFRMLQDVEINKDLSAQFKQFAAQGGKKTIADCINLKILNAGAWSRGRDKCHVSFPDEIDELIPDMEKFYKDKHTGRKLNWAHNWSSAAIAFVSSKGKYDLEVSAFQMALLFCWNDRPKEKISLEGLRLATELPDADLIRTIMSLATNPKVKIQVVMTESSPVDPKTFNDSTMFWINQDFAIMKGNKAQPRGRVNLVNRINMNQETIDDEAHEEILRLREYRIQEAIVKIMKMRRIMLYNPLHNELVDMLKSMFVPTRRLIKQQIEWLIEHDYIERDQNDSDKFVYIT
jgi:cullin-5